MRANTGIDAFGRSRVSTPTSIFSSKLTVDNQPLFWDDAQVSGTANSEYRTNESSVRLSVLADTAGRRVRQTKRRFNYQPGKSQLILMTGQLFAGGTGITKRVGYYDDNNGLFFEQKDGFYYVVKRSFVTGEAVETRIPQTEWNMGGNQGGVWDYEQFDLTKALIFYFNFEWLGVGSVEFGCVIGGRFYVIHQLDHSALNDNVYMTLPNLPNRYEIINDGTGAANFMDCICSTVVSEGGSELTGVSLAYTNSTGITTLNNANFYGIMAFRLKSTHLHATIDFTETFVICTSTAAYSVKLLLNPTVTGTALSFSDITNSALQVATPTNATTFTGGTELSSYVGQTSATFSGSDRASQSNKIGLGSTVAGVSDVIVLAVSRISGTTETFYGAANWIEIY